MCVQFRAPTRVLIGLVRVRVLVRALVLMRVLMRRVHMCLHVLHICVCSVSLTG